MVIVVDMDEVLAHFVQGILDRWNKRNGTNFTRDQVNMWRMENVLGIDKPSGRSAEGLIDEWIAEPGFYENLEPIAGAIDGFQYLLDSGHDVIICTSIPEIAINAYDGKRRWMRKYFPKWSMKNFIASSRKGLIDGDVLIDDGGHNAIAWCERGKSGLILMDAPWNRNFETDNILGVPYDRAFDWYDIKGYINRIAKEKYKQAQRIEGLLITAPQDG